MFRPIQSTANHYSVNPEASTSAAAPRVLRRLSNHEILAALSRWMHAPVQGPDENRALAKSRILEVLPKERGAPKTELSLFGLNLTSLPFELGQLVHLTELDLGFNQLTALPFGFENLTNLRRLDLYNNQLSTLPIGFERLTSLQALDLDGNNITSLPLELKDFWEQKKLGSVDDDSDSKTCQERYGEVTYAASRGSCVVQEQTNTSSHNPLKDVQNGVRSMQNAILALKKKRSQADATLGELSALLTNLQQESKGLKANRATTVLQAQDEQ